MKTYDPRMHSAKHILNQTMDRMYQCSRCFNAHIERKKSKCDYRFKKKLSAAEISRFKITSTALYDGVLRIRYKLEN